MSENSTTLFSFNSCHYFAPTYFLKPSSSVLHLLLHDFIMEFNLSSVPLLETMHNAARVAEGNPLH
jgi:hypothetical protein